MSASLRSLAARLLLDASGLVGSTGPRLAALCTRLADVASDAAHLVSPVAECPGCGAMATALAMAGRGVCPECAENEEEGPAPPPPDLRGIRWPSAADHDPNRAKPN